MLYRMRNKPPYSLHSCPFVAVLSFLHFSLNVSDLASFLLSLFHSSDGKLISTVWTQTDYQTDPDSTGATPLRPLAPPPLKLCLHTLLLQWKGPVSSLLSVLSSSLRLAGVIVAVGCGGSGGISEKNNRKAVQLLVSLLYGLWFACSDAAMTLLWTPKRLLTTSHLSCMSTSFAMWLFFLFFSNDILM